MKKILLVFTGGTICSTPTGENSKNQSNAKMMGSYLELNYKNSDSPFKDQVSFVKEYLSPDILSENMMVGSWNDLLKIFRRKELIDDCEGVIVLHGTDTLAYTASLLSLVLSGFEKPVCMVSAQLNLHNPKTNGYTNFRASVELIMNGIKPNVYVVYRNLLDKDHTPGKLLVHYGAHLTQCKNYSNNFHSYDEMEVKNVSNAKLKGSSFKTKTTYLDKFENLIDNVMFLQPYTNLRYSNIILDGICAVVHGTYHSESVCIGRAKDYEVGKTRSITLDEVLEADRPFSILSLLEKCNKKKIPLFLAPCNVESFSYGTTSNALECGALAIPNTTLELAYAKVILGCSLGKKGKSLKSFLSKNINREFIYENQH